MKALEAVTRMAASRAYTLQHIILIIQCFEWYQNFDHMLSLQICILKDKINDVLSYHIDLILTAPDC